MLFDYLVMGFRYICIKLNVWQLYRYTDLNFNFELQLNEQLGNYWQNLPGQF